MVEIVAVTHGNSAVDPNAPTTVVNVTDSGWFSKVNWAQAVQAIAAIAVIATAGKVNITSDQQLTLVTAILIVGNIVTVILKTYFTPTVAKQSISQ